MFHNLFLPIYRHEIYTNPIPPTTVQLRSTQGKDKAYERLYSHEKRRHDSCSFKTL